MREIKFRYWDKKDKCWLEPERILISGDGERYDYAGGDDIGALANPTKTVVMQYTGLKDKNGKEIYEGDVVRYKVDPTVTRFAMVQYLSGGFYLKNDLAGNNWLHDVTTVDDARVIGNIYENPELSS